MFYEKNIEGIAEYNIPDVIHRRPGVSAMLRLANEARFIAQSVLSILDLVDEVVCCLQNSTDHTEDILRMIDSDKIRVFHYPFESIPNGPGHDRQVLGSVNERAYFYNWCLSKTRHRWVSKWDGDMVALPSLADALPAAMATHDAIKFPGVEMVSMDRISKTHPQAASDVRFFRATSETYYQTGRFSEVLHLPESYQVYELPAQYLHFKWCKPTDAITKAWPDNWRNVYHFQQLEKRREPGEVYAGPIPEVLNVV